MSAAAFGHAGLGEGLSDLQPLSFKGVGRNDIDLTEAGDAGRNRREIVYVATETDVGQNLAAERSEVSEKTLALPMPALVFS